jgi:hypothetical protein
MSIARAGVVTIAGLVAIAAAAVHADETRSPAAPTVLQITIPAPRPVNLSDASPTTLANMPAELCDARVTAYRAALSRAVGPAEAERALRLGANRNFDPGTLTPAQESFVSHVLSPPANGR